MLVRVLQPHGSLEPPQGLDVIPEPGTGDYVWLADRRRVEIRDAVRTEDGRLRYLIAVDAPPPERSERRRDEDVMSTRVTSSLGLDLEVTATAAEMVLDRGGRLYLWQTSVGDAWLRDQLSFNKPDGVAFVRIPAGLIAVMVAQDVSLPEKLRISTRRGLTKRLRVEWDDATWGWRGGADAPSGDG